jgi:HSP20 family protein
VYETPESITIVAELAGMQRESIEVVIEGDIVSLRGNRPDPNVCDRRAFHEAHIAYGEFAADVFIPHSIDTERATATYENGFLIVELPRLQGRTIVPTTSRDTAAETRSDA